MPPPEDPQLQEALAALANAAESWMEQWGEYVASVASRSSGGGMYVAEGSHGRETILLAANRLVADIMDLMERGGAINR